jgi:CHAT domain-containing protein/Tfp pilus assembly protein PilF
VNPGWIVRRLIVAVSIGILFPAFCVKQVAFAKGNSQNQEAITTLVAGTPAEHDLGPGDPQGYQIALEAGKCAKLTFEQKGIEALAELFGPDKSLLAKFNDEVLPTGEQQISFVAEMAGSYTIRVKANLKAVPFGSYTIRLDETHLATDADRTVFEARKLQTQSLLLATAGKYGEALPFAEHALAIAEKSSAASQVYVAILVRNLGIIYWANGEEAKARPLFERSFAIFLQELGPEHPQTAYTENSLGNVYRVAGDYDKAEQVLRHALAVERRSLGPEHPWVADALKILALAYDARGDFHKAEENTQLALSIAEKTVGTESLLYSQLENNLGLVFLEKHEYEQARPHLERSLATEEKLFGPDYLGMAIVLQNLGIVAREAKNYALAAQYYDRALAIRMKVLGPEHRDIAGNMINIANLYHSKGDDAKCLEIHLRALKILEKTASPSEWVTIISLGNIAKTYAALGDLTNAVAFQSRADAAIEQSLSANLAIGSEQQKLEFINSINERTDRTVSLNLQLAPGDPKASSLAALVLLQRKGRVLDAMTDSMNKLRQRSDPQDQALLDQLKETTAQLARLGLNGPNKMPLDEYKARMTKLADQKGDLEAEINRHSLEFRAESAAVTLESVQIAIPENAALLEFVLYRPFNPKATSSTENYSDARYGVYVIRRNGVPQGVDLGGARLIQEVVEKFRTALRDPLNAGVRESSRRLDAIVMQPVRGLLGSATQLLISPDSDLNLIPFQALLDEDGHYLVQRYFIGYLSTGRDLLRLQIARPSEQGPVVVADPTFGEPPPTQMARADQTNPNFHSPKSMRRSITTAADLSAVYFAPLHGTFQEAHAIQSLFPEVQVLIGAQASKATLSQVNAPSLLHIATHGFFLQGMAENPAQTAVRSATKDTRSAQAAPALQNPLLRSGLALAGANLDKGTSDNGILTALEASDLNLWGTKLVTLSACDTGVGQVQIGEGVYGLRRAFFLAGTESLVMSLWPVSDYVTRQLMTQYYAGLKSGLGRGEALRQAQLAMLKRKGREHPFYWASFIQAGEWASLDGER